MSDNKAVADWISEICARTGWDGTRIAREAGLSPSTVLRIAKPDCQHLASLRTLRKIAEAAGVPLPTGFTRTKAAEALLRGGTSMSDEEAWTVPMRSFSLLPARLSPVKRGEIRIERPACLAGIEGAFAFHVWNDELAPAVRTRDLLYAKPGLDMGEGDLVVLEEGEDRARVGFLVGIENDGYRIMVRGGAVDVPAAQVVAVSTVVLVDRKGRTGRVRWDRPAA